MSGNISPHWEEPPTPASFPGIGQHGTFHDEPPAPDPDDPGSDEPDGEEDGFDDDDIEGIEDPGPGDTDVEEC